MWPGSARLDLRGRDMKRARELAGREKPSNQFLDAYFCWANISGQCEEEIGGQQKYRATKM